MTFFVASNRQESDNEILLTNYRPLLRPCLGFIFLLMTKMDIG